MPTPRLRPAPLVLALAAWVTLAPPAATAAQITLRLQQLTDSGPECTGGGSFYPGIDAKATLVAFTSFCDLVHGQNSGGKSELFVRNTGGGGPRQLTHTNDGIGISEPDLSSDGKLIVFASSSDLVAGSNTDGNNEIFLIHADGTGLAQLTHTTGGRALGFPGNTHPVFQPESHRIVFTSDRDLVPGGNVDGNNDLYVMDKDGTGLRQLTFTTGGWGINQGSLDAAGTRLVFDSDRDLVANQNLDAGFEIFTMNVDGSGIAQLTHSDTDDNHLGNMFPRWTADGQSIFFASDQDLTGGAPSNNYDVYHLDPGSLQVVQVTSCIGGFGAVPWGVALDGRTVSIESDCDLVPGANLDRNGEVYVQTWKPAQFDAAQGDAAAAHGAPPRLAAGSAAGTRARRLLPPRI